MAGRPIDEKIVAMKMDNSDLKQKAQETVGLLGKLQGVLGKIPGVDMTKITNSFGEIQSAAGKVDLSALSNNIDTIASRFTNLGVVATTALANISNRVVDTGLQMLNSLTTAPIMDGFREYENKMGSIGTMLANTEWAGSTLDDVKKTLGELNNYADNTIYSFEQMTANIGRFTAAGVRLEDSAIAIKGLGNLAAVSGSNVDQLNTVMYQMSQALAAGKLNLMDWNSLVNGGMAGKKTQDALVATARAMGKTVDLSDGFRNSIEQGWLTSEVFLETLKKFGKDESMTKAATSVRTFTGMIDALKESVGSGWATTWELMFGDFEDATKRWTGLSEAIGGFFKLADNARNSFVKKLADAGIFKGIFDLIISGGKATLSIFQAIGGGIKKAFSGPSMGILKSLSDGLKKMSESLKPSEETLSRISTIFQGLFSIVNVLVRAFVGLGKIVLKVVAIPLKLILWAIDGLATGILIAASYISELVIAFTDGIKSGKNLYSSLGGLRGVFSAIGSVIGKVVKGISQFASAIHDVWEILIYKNFSDVGPWASNPKVVDKLLKIREALVKVVRSLQEVWDILVRGDFTGKGPWGEDSKIVKKLFRIRQAVLDFGSGIIEAWNILAKGKFTGVGPWEEDSKIVNKLFKIRESVLEFTSGVVEAWNILAKGKFTGVGPWEEDSKIVDKLFKIREAVIDFVSGVVEAWNILANGDFTGKGPWEEDSKIVASLFKIREAVINLVSGVVEAWNILANGDFTGKGPWAKDSAIVNSLLKIREAFKSLGDYFSSMDLSLDPLINGFSAFISVITSGNWGSRVAKWLSKIGDGINALVGYLGGLKISLDPIVNGFKSFFSSIGKGFAWIKEKITAVGDAIHKSLPSGNKLFAGGFLTAVVAIVGMVLKMGWDLYHMFLGWGKIGEGISDVLDSTSKALNAFSMSVKANALLTIAIAVGILAVSLMLLSRLNPEKATTGLIAITTILAALIGGMKIMDQYDIKGNGMKSAFTMIAMGTAILIMTSALKKLSGLDPAKTTQGLYGLVGIMAALSGAITLMSRFGGGNVGASALQMIALSIAVLIMVKAIEDISKIKTEALKKGLTTLGFILLELGLFFAIIKGSRFGIGDALAIIAIARAINNIVDAIAELGNLKVSVLKQGLTTIGYILAYIALFSVITKGSGLLATGVGLLLISAALTALLVPISILGNMNLKTLAKGIGAIAAMLILIGGASLLMKDMALSGAGLILMAIALQMLLVPILAFAALSWGAIVKGIVGLAGALLIIGGAAALLGFVAAPMIMFGVAVGIIGLAMLAAGAGMSLFATGLLALATMSAGAITTIVATLTMLITGLASLIPMAVDFVAKLIMQMATRVMDMTPILVNRFLNMLLKVLNIIAEHTPDFVNAAVKIITNFLDALANNLPKIVESATNLMITFIEALSAAVDKNGPRFIDAVLRLIGQILILVVQAGVAVIQALFGWIPGVTDATNKIGNTAEETIRNALDAKGLGESKGKDFASGLGGKKEDAKTAGKNVGTSAKDGVNGVDLATIGGSKGDAFAKALGDKTINAEAAGKKLGKSGKDGAASVKLDSTGHHFGTGFAAGMNEPSVLDKVASAAMNLASTAKNKVEKWLHIASPSKVMRVVGGFFGEGFALGIVDKTKQVGVNAKHLALTAKDSLNQFLDGFELPNSDNELHFKAVIDYDTLDTSNFGNVGSLAIRPDVSLTNGLIVAPTKSNATTESYGQNKDNMDILKKQDEQISIMQKQIDILSNISNKDNSVYLDGKELYNSNKKIENHQTSIRNIFKGVATV